MRSSLRLFATPASTPSAIAIKQSSSNSIPTAPKRTSNPSRKPLPPPLSFEHFIQRNRALHLYRTILRSLYRIPADTRAEPVAYARNEFQRQKQVTDLSQIRYLISTGKTEFEGMQRYVDELAGRGGSTMKQPKRTRKVG